MLDVMHCNQKAVLLLKRGRITLQGSDSTPLRVEIVTFGQQSMIIDGKQLAVLIQTQPGTVSLEKLKMGQIDLNLFVLICFADRPGFLAFLNFLETRNLACDVANRIQFADLPLNKEAYNKAFSKHLLQQDSFFLLRCSSVSNAEEFWEEDEDEHRKKTTLLGSRSYRVLIKPPRKLIALFLPKHIPKVLVLDSSGSIRILDDDRNSSPAPKKANEHFNVADIDQI
jgi:hypothetical protein